MSVKVTDNSRELILTREQKVSLFLRLLIKDIHRTANPITPKDHGNLRADVIEAVNGLHGKLIWDKEYAAAQEDGRTRGHPIKNYSTPGTASHFAIKSVKSSIGRSQSILRQVGL